MAAQVFVNACRFNAQSGGVAPFVVASHVAGHKTPEEAIAVDGKVYRYCAQSPDGLEIEQGSGPYDYATHSLIRETIDRNSDNTFVPLDFSVAPIVDVFPSAPPFLESVPGFNNFPTGTRMLFQQSNVPIYWTKDTTHNDKALRVVSGNASSGGVNNFSAVFAQTTVGLHTPTIDELVIHRHSQVETIPVNFTTGFGAFGPGSGGEFGFVTVNTGPTGGSAPHDHTILMNIKYLDNIIGIKD